MKEKIKKMPGRIRNYFCSHMSAQVTVTVVLLLILAGLVLQIYVNKGADAKEADADVVIQVAVPAQTTVELCSTEAQAILSQENCIAIFGSNQTAAEGVLAANANLNVLGSDAGAGDVIGVGFDAGSIIKAAVQDGTFIGAVTQSPLMMGYYAIYALTAAANGQELEDVPTDGYWYDSTNMDSEEIAPNLYD